jgi:hypothetical protein
VYSLYVTDYTINPKIIPVQGSWCPPELAERILKVEMWDTASQLGQTMEPGEYWFLRNTRMKISGSGYLEGTIQLADKVRRLDESDPTRDSHLEALLEFVFSSFWKTNAVVVILTSIIQTQTRVGENKPSSGWPLRPPIH